MATIKARWAQVNGEPVEYLIGQGRLGDEFVEVDGECVWRSMETLDDAGLPTAADVRGILK